MSWTPILTGEDARRALRIVREVADAITTRPPAHDVASDLSGAAKIEREVERALACRGLEAVVGGPWTHVAQASKFCSKEPPCEWNA